MGYASKAGRAKTSATNPQAHAICDRCGFRYNHVDLKWQFDWRGTSLQNIKLLVCSPCYDDPQEQLRAIVVPADPTPIMNPRLQDFLNAESNYITAPTPTTYDAMTGIPVPNGDNLVTQNGLNITGQDVGAPALRYSIGLDPNAVMPLSGSAHFDVELPILSITADGTTVINVVCSSPHNLTSGDQIAVFGVTSNAAMGFYTVVVLTATAFTYEVMSDIPERSLGMKDGARIVTASVGIPYGNLQVPIVGIAGVPANEPDSIWINNSLVKVNWKNVDGDIVLFTYS